MLALISCRSMKHHSSLTWYMNVEERSSEYNIHYCVYRWTHFKLLSTCMSIHLLSYCMFKLEAPRERRPPWPRQIITPILPTVKILCLGGERLPPPPPPQKKKKFWIITCTTIWVCHHYYGVFCSFTHLRIPRSPLKFNQFFIVLPRTPP